MLEKLSLCRFFFCNFIEVNYTAHFESVKLDAFQHMHPPKKPSHNKRNKYFYHPQTFPCALL